MIRREVFLDFGGFDPRLYPRPAIEDIELGYRLTRAGHRIVLARDVLATHMKRWTLAEMVRTDIFRRGVPWMLLIKRTGTVETDLNVKADQKACVALTGLTLLAAACSRRGPAWARRRRGTDRRRGTGRDRRPQSRVLRVPRPPQGMAFACAALPLHLVYYCCCGLSVVIAMAHWRLGRTVRRRSAPCPRHRRSTARAAIARRRDLDRRTP